MEIDDSTPLFPLRPCRWLDLHLAFLNLIPIRTQCRPTTFLITLHHRPLRIFIRIRKDLLEKRVEGAIASNIGILIHCFLLFRVENVGSDAFPVFLLFSGSYRFRSWSER